jgi:hypothetical protein
MPIPYIDGWSLQHAREAETCTSIIGESGSYPLRWHFPSSLHLKFMMSPAQATSMYAPTATLIAAVGSPFRSIISPPPM